MKITIGMSLPQIEKEVITETLRFFDGNKRRTAQTLDISLKTLYNKLAEYEQQRRSA